MKLNIEYRRCYIYTWVDSESSLMNIYMAAIYDNGVCYNLVHSYISEEKAIDKAKAYIDELLGEIE